MQEVRPWQIHSKLTWLAMGIRFFQLRKVSHDDHATCTHIQTVTERFKGWRCVLAKEVKAGAGIGAQGEST